MVRDDLAQADVVVLERQFPGLAARLATAEQPSADDETAGVQPPHLALDTGEPVDNVPHEVRQLHPAPGTGCNQRANEVQLAQLRGAMVAPEPYKEPSRKPPAAPAHAPEAPHLGVAGGGRAVGEFFAVLGDGWRLTAAQRARLAPAVQAALDAGWLPQALAALHGCEHHRRAHPVRGAGRPALARRVASTPRATSCTATLVRPVRRGHADAGLRRRRAAPVSALQTFGRNKPRGSSRVGPCPDPLRASYRRRSQVPLTIGCKKNPGRIASRATSTGVLPE